MLAVLFLIRSLIHTSKMANFFSCNFCSTIQSDNSETKEDFFVTNCQHVFCLKCSEHCREINKCPKCSKTCKIIKIDEKMPEHVRIMFMPADNLLDSAVRADVLMHRRMDEFIAENSHFITDYEQLKKKAIKIQNLVKQKKMMIENEKHIIRQFKSGSISPG